MDRIRFGVFDHIEPLPGVPLHKLYEDRLRQMEAFDDAGFFARRHAGEDLRLTEFDR